MQIIKNIMVPTCPHQKSDKIALSLHYPFILSPRYKEPLDSWPYVLGVATAVPE
jgi:hypothetical protein